MTFKILYYPLLLLIFLSCNSGQPGKEPGGDGFDSCTVAVPFSQALVTEQMVDSNYTGELTNYFGGDNTKVDFRHVFEGGKIVKSIFYYENGHVREEYLYKCGSLHGIQTSYYEDGILAQKKPYRYGRLEGIGEAYDTNGILRQRVVLHADSVVSQTNFDSTGKETR